jgi:hypothetical protein
VIASAELSYYGRGLVDCPGDEVGILAVRRVPVPAIKDPDCVVVNCRKRLEEADEDMFVVDL